MIRAALAVVIVLALGASVRAQCLEGDYVVVGEPLLSSPGGAFARDVVTIADRTVAIASGCPAVPAQFRTTSRGIVVRAAWRACGTLAQRVRLRAIVNKSCRTMRGRFVTRRPRSERRFVARHAVPCAPGDTSCRTCEVKDDCAGNEYCAKPIGACGVPGSCESRPTGCTRDLRWVCGCNGVSYPNDCIAASYGASVAHDGQCTKVCGGIAGIPCPAGEFCDLNAGECHVTDGQGECASVPDACPLIYAPVCGCDGITYGNDCERQHAKAQKAHDGRCKPTAKCASACDCYRTQTFPEPCPLDCATCDNYWTCEDGTCVPHCGPVPEPPVCEPRVCGGIAGLPCRAGEFCELPKGECHAADLQGVCLPVPQVCPELYAPVCGCDGVTYSNECDRQVAGVQHAHPGPCGEKCETACDCEKTLPLPAWCSALACPACGCAWVCEAGTCGVQVKSPVPPPACQTS